MKSAKPTETFKFDIYIVPNASKTEFAGMHGERLKLKLHAPPVDGKANDEIIRFFAATLGVSKAQVRISRGNLSRMKTVEVSGLDHAKVISILGRLMQ